MLQSCGPRKVSPDRLQRPSLRVGIVLAEHFTLSAFAVFVDHLRLAADEGDRSRPVRVHWSIMSARHEPISASCGVALQPTSPLLPADALDYVVVVGGILHAGPQVDELTLRYLREIGAGGLALIGICTGSFVLCRAGLMKGRCSCVSWYHYQDFRERFPDHEVVAHRLFLPDGLRITCAGGAGTAALAASLLERHLVHAAALKADQFLLFDRPRGACDAQPHAQIAKCVDESRVRRTLFPMEKNLTQRLPFRAAATELGISVRQLERLCRRHFGVGPAALYRQMRMRLAHWPIENTNRPVIEIAIGAGFNDDAHFSRQFKGTCGLLPPRRRRWAHRSSATDRTVTRVFE